MEVRQARRMSKQATPTYPLRHSMLYTAVNA